MSAEKYKYKLSLLFFLAAVPPAVRAAGDSGGEVTARALL
jgi:hypothetical protein